jgi:hypothetical protein
MKVIKKFNEFLNSGVLESDGYGTSPFLMKKESGIYNYFFYIDTEEKEVQEAFRLMIGKYSDHQNISGAKNSYCVLSINKISHEVLEDIAVEKIDVPLAVEDTFKVRGEMVSRLFEVISKCILDYLEQNPKVSRIYDEIQDNLVFTGDGTYIEFMKSIIISYLGEDWSIQDGVDKKSVLISR